MPQASVVYPASQTAGTERQPAMNFLCDACQILIPGTAPRAHCLVCPDHDLCAACTLGERFVSPHAAGHAMQVYRVSGDNATAVVKGNWVLGYGTASPSPVPVASSSIESSSAAGGTSVGGTSFGGTATGVGGTSVGVITSGGIIAGETSSPAPASPSAPNGWGQFFLPADLSHTQIYAELIMTIFGYLDTTRSGFLAPEGYSRLLDDMGYPVHENIWKKNLTQSSPLQSREAAADAALRAAYDMFAIEYITQARPRATAPGRFSGFQSIAGAGTPMPLLTARGLGDIIAIELLAGPNDAFPRLAKVIQGYGLYARQPYAGWGAMPRTVLPAGPDPRMLARVQSAQTNAVQAAAIKAQLRAKADLAAVNAIGGTQWEMRPY
ncbi:unnamed protein product [Mycena citricolor]|uniref:ZZ-type domain-containing protein n=1 Tax=Mycena citricolor TaxID=2018698 RepID=A0AAD2I0E9_9AGAR|nr:unnamed protein product [Mycena citricolor]